MAKGIIYIMETVVPGLIKIGKTGSENFEQRMYSLERNGYNNVVGLKRRFAIEVEDYDAKEALLDSLFDKSRLQNSELFALDIDMAIQLLSSFDGRQVYPKNETKEQAFTSATENRKLTADIALIPNGVYYMDLQKTGFGRVTAKMKVEDGLFTVLKGSICCPTNASWVPAARKGAIIKNNVLMEDVECSYHQLRLGFPPAAETADGTFGKQKLESRLIFSENATPARAKVIKYAIYTIFLKTSLAMHQML